MDKKINYILNNIQKLLDETDLESKSICDLEEIIVQHLDIKASEFVEIIDLINRLNKKKLMKLRIILERGKTKRSRKISDAFLLSINDYDNKKIEEIFSADDEHITNTYTKTDLLAMYKVMYPSRTTFKHYQKDRLVSEIRNNLKAQHRAKTLNQYL